MTNSALRNHFKAKHEKEIKSKETQASESQSQDAPLQIFDINADGSRKRKNVTILDLCAKKNRSELFQSSIPGWIESKTTLKFGSEKAKRMHKSVFEYLVLDLKSFHSVALPGFLRHQQIMMPNFQVASPKYYRSMLDPAYESIKTQMKAKLAADSPPSVSVGLDLWSKHHHGYLGKLKMNNCTLASSA